MQRATEEQAGFGGQRQWGMRKDTVVKIVTAAGTDSLDHAKQVQPLAMLPGEAGHIVITSTSGPEGRGHVCSRQCHIRQAGTQEHVR